MRYCRGCIYYLCASSGCVGAATGADAANDSTGHASPTAYIAGAPGGDLDLAINDATKKANIVVENIKALAAVLAMATKKYSLANAAIGACVSVN